MKDEMMDRLAINDNDFEKECEESESICQIHQDVTVNEGPAFKAVRDNDIPRLSAIMFSGYDLNSVNENEDSPEKNTFYEFRDWNRMARGIRLKGYTPLHLAVVHSKFKVIKYLLSKGADVNILDANLISPLSLAAAVQRPDIVQMLITAGSIIDSQSVSGRTPLIQAISNNNYTIVGQLLRAGADPNLADTKGTTPLLMCLQARKDDPVNIKVLKALIHAGSKVDFPNKQGGTGLMLAVAIGRLDAVNVLLKAGADINLRDKADQTVLHLASGGTTAVYLLNHGATSDWPDRKGITPLLKAAKVGHVYLTSVFLASDSQCDSALLELPRMVQVREQLPLFDQWLQQEFGSPRSLRRLCRQVVRQCLSPSNTAHIKNLPIPQMVQDFLLCKHMDLPYSRPRR